MELFLLFIIVVALIVVGSKGGIFGIIQKRIEKNPNNPLNKKLF